MSPTEKPYGLWQSQFSIESIFKQPSIPTYPFEYAGHRYWLQALASEGGRTVLMRRGEGGGINLTPAGFNIRSRVHEYGGRCFCQHAEYLLFNNFADGRIYRQSLVNPDDVVAITEANATVYGFADLVSHPQSNSIIAITEYAEPDADGVSAHQNAIARINLDQPPFQSEIVIRGKDFYAAPTINSSGTMLAWIEWDLPFMPWDQTRLCVAPLRSDAGGWRVGQIRSLIEQPQCCISKPGFLHDDSLVFARDDAHNNWSNLWRWHDRHCSPITNIDAEFGDAHWLFGQTRWIQSDDDTLLAVATTHTGDTLYQVSVAAGYAPRKLHADANICHLQKIAGGCLMVASPQGRIGEVVEAVVDRHGGCQIVPLSATARQKSAIAVSKPQPFSCNTTDGETTYGYFYRPCNAAFVAPADTLPPVVVMVHGGPTSRTDTRYNPLKQYFTSLGFAIMDINHRGSTGYGRSYRQRLLGQWGEVDAIDIADAIGYLADSKLIDAEAVFIRGSSAGGYAVQRALTRYPKHFAGGACYYGIGNLITLSEITHKFESKYTDRLIGQTFDPQTARLPASRFVSRSPIFAIEKLQAPLILFQGSDDKVVPPAVSQEVVAALKRKGIKYAYTEYPGEGHGFRKSATRIDALQQETAFFIEVLTDNTRNHYTRNH